MVAYTAIFSCGNYQGVACLAKAKGLAVPIAHTKVSSRYLMMTRDSATGLPLLSKTGFLMDGIAVENERALVGQILFQVLVPDALQLQKPI